MTQRIWLIRHGKSSRPFGVIDHQRPLSKRATADAALIRQWLGDEPKVFVASTARRAWETAQLIAGDRPITTREELYLTSTGEFLEVVEDTLRDSECAAFVAHNPAITVLVNRLAGEQVTDNVPTLGVAAYERREPNSAWRLRGYVAPKQLRTAARRS